MLDLPLQVVGEPLHVALGWHVLTVDPLRMKPVSQLKSTLFGNNVESPKEEPFTGTDKEPQSTA